jgi:putative SOS response-associated peptidase YedK
LAESTLFGSPRDASTPHRSYRLTLDYEINTAPVYKVAPTVEAPFVTAGEDRDHKLCEAHWLLVPW